MFENIIKFFKNLGNKEKSKESSDTAKERLHLVLMQDRANVSADFLELMKQEIIEVIKKYIDVDEKAIDVRLTNKTNDDGTVGAPALYANIPIVTIKNEARKANVPHNKQNGLNNSENGKETVEAKEQNKTNVSEKVEETKTDDQAEKSKQTNTDDQSKKSKQPNTDNQVAESTQPNEGDCSKENKQPQEDKRPEQTNAKEEQEKAKNENNKNEENQMEGIETNKEEQNSSENEKDNCLK